MGRSIGDLLHEEVKGSKWVEHKWAWIRLHSNWLGDHGLHESPNQAISKLFMFCSTCWSSTKDWEHSGKRPHLLAYTMLDRVSDVGEEQDLWMKSVALMSHNCILPPTTKWFLGRQQLSYCDQSVNLDLMPDVHLLQVQLDHSWMVHAWGNPSGESMSRKRTLVCVDHLAWINVCPSPEVLLEPCKDMSLYPEDLQRSSDLPQQTQGSSWWHGKSISWRHRAQECSLFMVKMPMLATSCWNQPDATCSTSSKP